MRVTKTLEPYRANAGCSMICKACHQNPRALPCQCWLQHDL